MATLSHVLVVEAGELAAFAVAQCRFVGVEQAGYEYAGDVGVIWLKKEKVAVWDSFKINSLQVFFV